MKLRNLIRRALFDAAIVASIALVGIALLAYARTDKAPQLAKAGPGEPTYVSAPNGRVQLFSDRDHETILTDEFVADPTVFPPIMSDRKFLAAGLHYRSTQWGDGEVWRLSIAAPVSLILPDGLAAAVLILRRRKEAAKDGPPAIAESAS